MFTLLSGKNLPANWIIPLLSVSCGVFVANLYYIQPLLAPISSDLQLPLSLTSLLVTITQIGYVLGLLFIVPLCDLLENRRLILSILFVVIGALFVVFYTKNPLFLFSASLFIGIGSVATQILVPYAAHLAPVEHRGQAVGKVMSGLLLGIMLARPLAGLLADLFAWNAIFLASALLTGTLTFALFAFLPARTPSATVSYIQLLRSLWIIFTTQPVLRRRSFYQACLFGAFSLFWTTIPLWLAQAFSLSQKEIALFALVGVTGAIIAPIAGRLSDKGGTRALTGGALLLAATSFILMMLASDSSKVSLFLLTLAAIILDMAVSANLVLSQRIIYSLGEEIRGRVNGIFMSLFFMGGAAGSALGGWIYAADGWQAATYIGLAMIALALAYYLIFPDKKYAACKNM